MIGKRIDLRERLILAESLCYSGFHGLVRFLKRVVLFVVLTETLGTLVLALLWLRDMDPAKALWMVLFHSVSAFNNAGFSILPGGLETYRHDLPVLLVFAVLIALGGLGFYVAWDVFLFLRGKVPRLSTHTKVVLLSSSLLLTCGWVLLMLTEIGHRGEPVDMVFLSVSSRTAGFSTVDLSQLSESSLFLLIILMFIGASPGGTGGGVKTVTFTLIRLFNRRPFSGR